MIALFSHAPTGLIVGALVALTLVTPLTVYLGWHALRRMFGVPRVPRERATYVLMAVLWGGLIAVCGATVAVALLLRDHRPADDKTPLAEVRCEAIAPGRLRLEVTATPSLTSERYDLEGEDCVLSVSEVELRPGLGVLGLRELARVNSVGALARPRTNPDWLTPRSRQGRRLLDLIVRRTHDVSVVVPPDAQERVLVVASPGGPVLARARI